MSFLSNFFAEEKAMKRVNCPGRARLLVMKKIINLSNEDLIKRFEREARLTRGFVHPNIVRYGGEEKHETFLEETCGQG